MDALTEDGRVDAVRALEVEFTSLATRYRRIIAERAERLSPGMHPGTFKVFTVIARHAPVTLSWLVDELSVDKGQLSRAVRELERLDLVERAPDPDDGRSSLISPTVDGLERLANARAPRERLLGDVLADWQLDDIQRLTQLLHALNAGARP